MNHWREDTMSLILRTARPDVAGGRENRELSSTQVMGRVMSSMSVELVSRRSFRPSFYFWIAFVMAAYVFGGFSLAALQRYLTNDATTMPPVVHLHGIVFISWMTLLMVQTWLINVRNVALHRSLGTFGIALGMAVLFTGMLIVALAFSNRSNGDPIQPVAYDLFFLSLAALGGFAVLFTLAIRHVRDPENHRRLVLFATIPLLSRYQSHVSGARPARLPARARDVSDDGRDRRCAYCSRLPRERPAELRVEGRWRDRVRTAAAARAHRAVGHVRRAHELPGRPRLLPLSAFRVPQRETRDGDHV
jgi:predicted transporter